MTPLHSTLKRALTIDGRDYVLTLNEKALKLTLKGKRNGVELPWSQLVNGEAALAVALHASLGAFAKKDKAAGAERLPSAKSSAAAKPPAAIKPSPRRQTETQNSARSKKMTRQRPR
jgi:hypothetical protein